jgi:hypothetical protein
VALERGVADVGDKCQGEQSEEPLAPGHEEVLKACVIGQVVRKQQAGQEVVQARIGQDERVELERPADAGQPELPPPEMDCGQQDGSRPCQVDDVELSPARVLDEA